MCSSDKQNMGDIKIDNALFQGFLRLIEWAKSLPGTIRGKKIEEKRTALENLVEEAWGVIGNGERLNSAFIRKLIEAENYGDAIYYLFHNNLIGDPGLQPDVNRIGIYIDKLFEQLNNLISEPHTNHQLGNVRRYLLLLLCFDNDFVFNLKRVTRLSVTKENLLEFLEIIGEDSNHFLLNANGRKEIKTEWDSLSTIPRFEGITIKQIHDYFTFRIFKGGTNITDLPNFEQLEFMLLRYLSLRGVNRTNGQNLNLNKLSSLKYLDLKHTKVKDCSWFECLEKLQMLDLRYTYVKEIPDNILEKLGKLQHLLLGYIKEEGENQLAGTKLNVKKLKTTNLKTLRAIEQPEVIEEISSVSNVVDLSVTGLTMEGLQTFWGVLEKFEKMTSLGVAVTHQSAITLQDCGVELKNKLKRLRMEGLHSGLEKLGEFGNLTDLTLASHQNIDINSIPVLPNLLCLRLYGVCQETTCQIRLQGFGSLKKLVIGDMGKVETVQIGSDVFQTVATLKFSKLPWLKEVVYTDEQHSFLRWGNSTTQVCSREVQLDKTIFLRDFEDFPVDNSPGLKIYRYNMEMQCYRLNATQNNQG